MQEETTGSREFDPVMGTHPDPNKIQCASCKFRDRTVLKFATGKKTNVGVIKAFCEKYPRPPKSNGKPHDVLYNLQDCEFYEMEE